MESNPLSFEDTGQIEHVHSQLDGQDQTWPHRAERETKSGVLGCIAIGLAVEEGEGLLVQGRVRPALCIL